MLLRNLTLALGFIGTSLAGSIIAISNSNQNNLKTLQNQAVGLSKTETRELMRYKGRELTSWKSLWDEIAGTLKFTEPGGHFTPEDIKENIAYLKEYLSIDDDFTNQHVGILNPEREKQTTSKQIFTHQYVLNNNTDFEQTLYVPSRNYNLKNSASWEFVDASRFQPLTEKLSFMWDDQQINIDLKKTKTCSSSKEIQQAYPLQEIKTKSHSKTIFQEDVVNYQTAIRGNILYSLNTKDLRDFIFFKYHTDDGYKVYATYDFRQTLDALRKKNDFGQDIDMFQPASNDLIVYKDNQYFYSFPVVWVSDTQTVETNIISK